MRVEEQVLIASFLRVEPRCDFLQALPVFLSETCLNCSLLLAGGNMQIQNAIWKPLE